jgi:hypothetical protein
MTLRDYLIALSIGTLAALAAAGIVIFAIDPVSAGGLAFLALYITLGAAGIGFFSLIGTAIRMLRNPHADVGMVVARSLRQGIFFAVLLVVALSLSSHGMLTVWTVLLLVILVTLVEFFFLVGRQTE